jgi:hypothetical protein
MLASRNVIIFLDVIITEKKTKNKYYTCSWRLIRSVVLLDFIRIKQADFVTTFDNLFMS